MNLVLAADIGGTNIRAAVIAEGGKIVQSLHSRIPLGEHDISETALVNKLTVFFAEMIEREPEISSVGIGFPGFFQGHSGLLIASPNLPNLRQTNLAKQLSTALRLPVFMQNDALCAAIGEHRFGAGRNSNNLLHITLGTGIGGGLILNNAPYTGEEGMAMEFGHLIVNRGSNAHRCGCSGRGCVEAYASANAIKQHYAHLTGMEMEACEIYDRALTGETDAKEIFEGAGIYLGMAIAEAVKLLDIHTVTISGGLTGAWPLLHPSTIRSMNDNLIPPLKGKVSVLKSTLNDNAGLLGAATLTGKAVR